jgi:hypothetical protein
MLSQPARQVLPLPQPAFSQAFVVIENRLQKAARFSRLRRIRN